VHASDPSRLTRMVPPACYRRLVAPEALRVLSPRQDWLLGKGVPTSAQACSGFFANFTGRRGNMRPGAVTPSPSRCQLDSKRERSRTYLERSPVLVDASQVMRCVLVSCAVTTATAQLNLSDLILCRDTTQ
jgi:hypothetical protein